MFFRREELIFSRLQIIYRAVFPEYLTDGDVILLEYLLSNKKIAHPKLDYLELESPDTIPLGENRSVSLAALELRLNKVTQYAPIRKYAVKRRSTSGDTHSHKKKRETISRNSSDTETDLDAQIEYTRPSIVNSRLTPREQPMEAVLIQTVEDSVKPMTPLTTEEDLSAETESDDSSVTEDEAGYRLAKLRQCLLTAAAPPRSESLK